MKTLACAGSMVGRAKMTNEHHDVICMLVKGTKKDMRARYARTIQEGRKKADKGKTLDQN